MNCFVIRSGLRRKKRCLLVEEPLVTRETLAPALTYLEKTSDLLRARDLMRRPELHAYFNELLEEQKSIDFPELIQEFDRIILLNSRIDGHKQLIAGIEGQDPSATLRPLRQFVASRSSNALGELIRGLERKCRDGWTVRRLTHEIFRITQKLLDRSDWSTGAEGTPSIQAMQEQDLGVVVWTSTLLGWTDRLLETQAEVTSKPRPNLFLVTVDQLGRDFMRRCSPEMAGDPLASLWSDVRRAIPTLLSEPDEPKNSKDETSQRAGCLPRSSWSGEFQVDHAVTHFTHNIGRHAWAGSIGCRDLLTQVKPTCSPG